MELDQAELIIPLGGQEVVSSGAGVSNSCGGGGSYEVGDLIPLPSHESTATHKAKRKTQHQPRHIEAKRVRVKSESAAVGQHSYHQQLQQHHATPATQTHHHGHAGGGNNHRNGVHHGPGIVRSSSLSSSSSLHQLVAEEFIRKVRSTSESKDDLDCCHDSNGSATNSAVEDEGEDEDDDNEIHVRTTNRQFIFDLKVSCLGDEMSAVVDLE